MPLFIVEKQLSFRAYFDLESVFILSMRKPLNRFSLESGANRRHYGILQIQTGKHKIPDRKVWA